MNTQQNRQQGSLPGKSEQNPKETMKAITLRSGKELPQRALTKDAEKQGEGVAINIDDEVVIVDEKINDEILEKIVEAKGKGVGTEIRTVDFRLNKETRKTLISQRTRISANYHTSSNQNTRITTIRIRNRKREQSRSNSESAYERLQQGISLGSRPVGEIPSSSNPKTAKPN